MKNFVNILVLIIIVSIAYFIMNKKKKIDQLDWENPSVISINKESARAHFFDFESKELKVFSSADITIKEVGQNNRRNNDKEIL